MLTAVAAIPTLGAGFLFNSSTVTILGSSPSFLASSTLAVFSTDFYT
jgi:hypothetical protein